jgi:hypothetical protein
MPIDQGAVEIADEALEPGLDASHDSFARLFGLVSLI